MPHKSNSSQAQRDRDVDEPRSPHVEKQNGHEPRLAQPPGPEARADTVTTSDPAVNADAGRMGDPLRTVSLETTDVGGAPVEMPPAPQSDKRQPSEERDNQARKEGRPKEEADNRPQEPRGQPTHQQGHDESRRDDRHDHHGRRGDEPRHKRRKHADRRPAAPRWTSLLITAAIALACGFLGAWTYSALVGPSKSDKPSEQKEGKQGGRNKQGGGQKGGGKKGGDEKQGGDSSSSEDHSGASASQIPGFTSADDLKTLKKQIEFLSKRLDSLGNRIDTTSKPADETPPVLHTVQMQLAELSKQVDEVANLPAQLRRVDRRLSNLQERFKTLRAEVTANDEISLDDSFGPSDVPPAMGSGASDQDPTLELAIGLFQEGQYSHARKVLVRLQHTRPKDARVWYFSALADGLTTNVWDGETKMLVDRGIECERSGNPDKGVIDAALANVSRQAGRDWLQGQRREARQSDGGQDAAE